jgi:hypothetical protein
MLPGSGRHEGADLIDDPAAGPGMGTGQDGDACFGGRGGEPGMHRRPGQIPVLARIIVTPAATCRCKTARSSGSSSGLPGAFTPP